MGGKWGGGGGLNRVYFGQCESGQVQNTLFKIDAKCKTLHTKMISFQQSIRDSLVPGSDVSLRASSPHLGDVVKSSRLFRCRTFLQFETNTFT